eukprot:358526-Chlamydomonas_euryale.AAC.7
MHVHAHACTLSRGHDASCRVSRKFTSPPSITCAHRRRVHHACCRHTLHHTPLHTLSHSITHILPSATNLQHDPIPYPTGLAYGPRQDVQHDPHKYRLTTEQQVGTEASQACVHPTQAVHASASRSPLHRATRAVRLHYWVPSAISA